MTRVRMGQVERRPGVWLHPYDEGYPHEELTMAETQERCSLCGRTDKHAHYSDDPAYATETQDGERHEHSMWECGRMKHVDSYHWMDEPCSLPEDDPFRCRFEPYRNTRLDLKPATPTPDDRDREVERIAAAFHSAMRHSYHGGGWDHGDGDIAHALYDAGLRASGGTAE